MRAFVRTHNVWPPMRLIGLEEPQMARGLYRVYLYVVTIALLIAATVAVGNLLGKLLQFTALRGQYSTPPNSASFTQTIVLTIVTLIIVLGMGGLHYWLIRRDMASDPQPGTSGVRSFLLNLAEAIATLVAVIAGAAALSQFDLNFQNDIATTLAAALAAGGLVLALEFERWRAVATRGAALVFQRLRIDGLSFILVFPLLGFLGQAVYQTETLIGQATGAIQCMVTQPNGQYFGSYYPPCVDSHLIGQWAAVALTLGVWLLYLRVGASDLRTLIRPVFLLLGFAAGMISLVVRLAASGRVHPVSLYLDSGHAARLPQQLRCWPSADHCGVGTWCLWLATDGGRPASAVR